eukprot:5198918-Prymnesium_polylepis.1
MLDATSEKKRTTKKKERKDQRRAAANDEDDDEHVSATAAAAPVGALPSWAAPPTATVVRLSRAGDPTPLDKLGGDLGSFAALIGRVDRHGARLAEGLVRACVRGCIPTLGALGEAAPSVIQSECWGWTLAPSPPDV